ncbi:DUF3137 domain-containing protein [bacterium]|nr:DUF3137 domain-containing protein [bacterium]
MTRNFQEFLLEYKKEISSNKIYTDKQEELKNSVIKQILFIIIISISVGVSACFFISPFVGISLMLLIAAYTTSVIPYAEREYKKFIKTKLHPKLISLIGNIRYSKYCIDRCEISNCGLFRETDNYSFSQSSDDEFEGEYKGINFKISETHISYSNGETLFSGIMIIFDYNKKILHPCCVSDRKFIDKKQQASRVNTSNQGEGLVLLLIFLWDIIVSIKKLRRKRKEKKRITLEDPLFMKRFIVEADDEIEARYLLTPSFMERFLDFKTKFKADSISCSFYDNKFMVLISTDKDLFETGTLFQNLDDPEFIIDFYDEAATVFNMIDYFKLDEKTGL